MTAEKRLAPLLYCLAVSHIAGAGAVASDHNAQKHERELVAPAVYFLGVDQTPAGAQGERLATLYSSTPRDRWALTDEARRIATSLGGGSISLDAPLDRWDPSVDPYNFGVIVLRGASHRTLTWKGSNSVTHVSMDMTWLQIGHEQQTRMQTDKLPELRFSVSAYDISLFNSQMPPDQGQLDAYYREAFTNAASELLRRVRSRYTRELNRSAADLRYAVVTPPIVLPGAQRQAAEFFGPEGGTDAMHRLSDALGAYLEHKLLETFATDASFDSVVLLPNAHMVAYLQAEWSNFARRVTALSSYSANLSAIGFRTPRLLRAVPLCTTPGENQVHALELRSNLTGVHLDVEPDNRHFELVMLTASVAGDVKIPVDTERSLQPLGQSLSPLHRHVMHRPIENPADIPATAFLSQHTLQQAISLAADALAGDLAARLRQILASTPPLSHPSYQERCREA